MERKLLYYDRRAALAFHPRYCKEHKKLFPSSSPSLKNIFSPHNEIGRFKKRWGLKSVVDPEVVKRELVNGLRDDVEGGSFLDYEEQLKIIPWKNPRQGETLDLSRNLRDRKYLTIQLDITRNEADTLNDIKGYINFYRNVTKFRATSNRATPPGAANHWLIYKMRHCDGKSLPQITKELFGVSSTPAYNPRTDARYKQVVRAYKKAKQIISQTNPQEPSS